MAPTKETAPRCEQHSKIEYQLAELVKMQDKQADEIKEFKENTEAAMGEIKKEMQRMGNDIVDGKRNPKILIALIGLAGVAMSTTGSVIGVLIAVYFKIGAPIP